MPDKFYAHSTQVGEVRVEHIFEGAAWNIFFGESHQHRVILTTKQMRNLLTCLLAERAVIDNQPRNEQEEWIDGYATR